MPVIDDFNISCRIFKIAVVNYASLRENFIASGKRWPNSVLFPLCRGPVTTITGKYIDVSEMVCSIILFI